MYRWIPVVCTNIEHKTLDLCSTRREDSVKQLVVVVVIEVDIKSVEVLELFQRIQIQSESHVLKDKVNSELFKFGKQWRHIELLSFRIEQPEVLDAEDSVVFFINIFIVLLLSIGKSWRRFKTIPDQINHLFPGSEDLEV